ncbi:hypothetical protein [Bacillus spizizenii]|uniref:hypothetical protein n=1 Tax=Bacillus spizizenii TaxID=96241 RepID=UPI003D260518
MSKFSPDAILTKAEDFLTNIVDKISEKFNFLNPDKIANKAEKFFDILSQNREKFEKFSPDKIIEKVGEFFEKIIKGIAEKLVNLDLEDCLAANPAEVKANKKPQKPIQIFQLQTTQTALKNLL